MLRSAMSLLTTTLVPLLAVSSTFGADRYCAQAVEVEIERLAPIISFKGQEINRLDRIALMMPVDCDDGSDLKPLSLAQALEWLDRALPINYKSALIKGNVFSFSSYGSSVDSDLAIFLQERWELRKHGPVCVEAMARMPDPEERQRLLDDQDVIYCGPDLLLVLKDEYLE